jgi:hypothetical protein
VRAFTQGAGLNKKKERLKRPWHDSGKEICKLKKLCRK